MVVSLSLEDTCTSSGRWVVWWRCFCWLTAAGVEVREDLVERAAPDTVEPVRAVVVVDPGAPVPAATPGVPGVLLPEAEAEVALPVPSREVVAEAREEAVVPA